MRNAKPDEIPARELHPMPDLFALRRTRGLAEGTSGMNCLYSLIRVPQSMGGHLRSHLESESSIDRGITRMTTKSELLKIRLNCSECRGARDSAGRFGRSGIKAISQTAKRGVVFGSSSAAEYTPRHRRPA